MAVVARERGRQVPGMGSEQVLGGGVEWSVVGPRTDTAPPGLSHHIPTHCTACQYYKLQLHITATTVNTVNTRRERNSLSII